MANSPAFSYRKSFALPAKPAPIFEVLTNPLHLKVWFAEQVEVEPRVGGAFRFWGRHTLWGEDPKLANQRITGIEFPSALGFTWSWGGCPSQVLVSLTPHGDFTRVEVRHDLAGSWDERLPGTAREARARRLVESFWDLAIGNMRHYLIEGEPASLPDFATAEDENEGELRLSLRVEAPADEAFAALVEPERLEAWIARSARVEPAPGGEYVFGWSVESEGGVAPVGPRQLLALRPDEFVEHDWVWPGEGDSRVLWEIEPDGLETRVELTHAGVSGPLYRLEWSAALLALRAHLEGWSG